MDGPKSYVLAREAFDELLLPVGYCIDYAEYSPKSFGSAYAVYRPKHKSGMPWYQLIWDGKDFMFRFEKSDDGNYLSYLPVTDSALRLKSTGGWRVKREIQKMIEAVRPTIGRSR